LQRIKADSSSPTFPSRDQIDSQTYLLWLQNALGGSISDVVEMISTEEDLKNSFINSLRQHESKVWCARLKTNAFLIAAFT
jgi:hypothetical protein